MEKPLEEFHENPRKRLINEILVEGKGFATQLQTLLQQPIIADHGSASADELLVKIWSSFTQAITEVNTLGSKGIFQNEEVDQSDSSDRKSKDSSSEFTRKKNKLVGKDRRGCYKRRKTSNSLIRESATIEDGCAWRKYGQKNILNSKYPRCYFRCTHKYDQDCKATKQVQIIQENPIIYHTTYFGNHTCNSGKISKHEIISSQESNHSLVESPHFEMKPKVLSSETHDSTVKLEEESNKVQSDVSSTTMDSNLWQDFMPSSPSAHSTMADHSSYFDQVITSSDMEEFGKFGDFHFEEFS